MAPQNVNKASAHVEVSGWNLSEEFFVEKGLLSSDGDGEQRIVLQTWLRVGSLVFVRCSDRESAMRSIPVTYQVSRISQNGACASREICLKPMRACQAQSIEFSESPFIEASTEARPN